MFMVKYLLDIALIIFNLIYLTHLKIVFNIALRLVQLKKSAIKAKVWDDLNPILVIL